MVETLAALKAGIRSFTFHGDRAPVLSDVHVSFPAGTLTAILGASGSGKSTLGRVLAGWLHAGTGGKLEGYLDLSGTRLQFTGHDHDPRIHPAQWASHVGYVPQDPSAVLSSVRATVAEELAFGLENAGMERIRMQEAVERTARLLDLESMLDRRPETLSGGQLRRLAIGIAVITKPAVLILDEPFGSLDPAGVRTLAALLQTLAAAGTAVVVLSQVVEEALRGAETWVVLERGTVTATGTPAEVDGRDSRLPAGIRRPGAPTQPHAAAPMPRHGGSTPAGREAPGTEPPGTEPPGGASPVLELRNVSYSYLHDRGRGRQAKPVQRSGAEGHTVLCGINLAVHAGEIVAITGPNGAGKSTLLRQFNGLLRPSAGSVLVQGRDIGGTPVGLVAASVGLLFQNPRHQLFERTAAREVRFGLDRGPGAGTATERTEAALASVGLAGAAEEHPAELPSAGQRLLALATVLARRPLVLALDEPTVALDGTGLALLDASVRSAAAAGAGVVLVTHDSGYARSVADRLLVLAGGRLEAAG